MGFLTCLVILTLRDALQVLIVLDINDVWVCFYVAYRVVLDFFKDLVVVSRAYLPWSQRVLPYLIELAVEVVKSNDNTCDVITGATHGARFQNRVDC